MAPLPKTPRKISPDRGDFGADREHFRHGDIWKRHVARVMADAALGARAGYEYLKRDEEWVLGQGPRGSVGNPDHLKELLKGVEHWNAWRKEQGKDFRPDFDGVDIDREFVSAGIIRREYIADLSGVDFSSANLKLSSMRNLDIKNADLRLADLAGADFRDADVYGTRVETIANHQKNGSISTLIASRTDVSRIANLTESQLGEMYGDSETIIPERMGRPSHWPEFNFAISFEILEQEQPNSKHHLTQHLELLLTTLPAASSSAYDLAIRLRTAGQIYDNELGVNGSDESRMLDQIAAAFASLGEKLKELEERPVQDALIEELRRELAEKEARIAELTAALCAQPSAAKAIMIGALAGAGGTAIIGTAGYLLGPSGGETIQNLWNLLTSGGTVPPPPPSLPTTTLL